MGRWKAGSLCFLDKLLPMVGDWACCVVTLPTEFVFVLIGPRWSIKSQSEVLSIGRRMWRHAGRKRDRGSGEKHGETTRGQAMVVTLRHIGWVQTAFLRVEEVL
jgi:hypothetical protein